MTKEVKALNNEFYEIFGDYHENREIVPDEKLRAYMKARFFELYKEEYMCMYARCEIQKMQEMFRTKERRAVYIPRPWHWYTFWRRANKAAKLFEKEIAEESENFFAKLQNKLFGKPAQEEAAKNEIQPPQVPENGDKGAPMGADRPGTNPQNGGQNNVANDGGQIAARPTGANDRSEKTKQPAPAKTKKAARDKK